MSKCGCRPGMYCTMDFKDCSSCVRYRPCNVGYGVSKAGTSPTFSLSFDENQGKILKNPFFFWSSGTAESDVRCKPCPDGTFSDKDSSTEPCQPHRKWAEVRRLKIKLWQLKSRPVSLSVCLSSCQGRVIRAGNATVDTVCQPGESFPNPARVFATPTTDSAVTPTPSIGPSASEVFFNRSTKISISDKNLGTAADILL